MTSQKAYCRSVLVRAPVALAKFSDLVRTTHCQSVLLRYFLITDLRLAHRIFCNFIACGRITNLVQNNWQE